MVFFFKPPTHRKKVRLKNVNAELRTPFRVNYAKSHISRKDTDNFERQRGQSPAGSRERWCNAARQTSGGYCPRNVERFYPYENNDSVPYVMIKIKELEFKAIVDSGASKSMCSSDYIERLYGRNYRNYLRKTRISTVQADGSNLNILGEITVQMQLRNDLYTLPLVVFESKSPVCLLGFDFFKRNQLVIYTDGLGTSPKYTNFKKLPRNYNLILSENVSVPASSYAILGTEIRNDDGTKLSARELFSLLGLSGLASPVEGTNFSENFSATMVTISNNSIPMIFETTECTDDVTIPKGTIVGKLTNYNDASEFVEQILLSHFEKVTPSKGRPINDVVTGDSSTRESKDTAVGFLNKTEPSLEMKPATNNHFTHNSQDLLDKFYLDYLNTRLPNGLISDPTALNNEESLNNDLKNLIHGLVKGDDALLLASLKNTCKSCDNSTLLLCGMHTLTYKRSLGLQDNRELLYCCMLCKFLCSNWRVYSDHARNEHDINVGKRSSEPENYSPKGEKITFQNCMVDHINFLVNGEDICSYTDSISVSSSQGLMPHSGEVPLNVKQRELKQIKDFVTNPSVVSNDCINLEVPSCGTSSRSNVSDGSVRDIRQLLGSNLSSKPPSISSVHEAKNVSSVKRFSAEHEDLKLEDINFYYSGKNSDFYKKEIIKIMKEVPTLWASSNYDLGDFKYEVKVPLKRKLPHFSHAHRSLHPNKTAAAAEIIEKLQQQKVMNLGLSTWSSPACWVEKAAPDAPLGGGAKLQTDVRNLRLAVDYRQANMFVRNVSCPTPSAKQMCNVLSGKRFASIVDIAHGFWCIRIDELSKKFFSVQALGQVYNFSRLPMGSLSSPAIFIACVLYSIRGLDTFCFAYADNLTIVSNTLDEHLTHIRLVFKRLSYYGWKIKYSKVHFAMHDTPLKFLGFFFNLKEQSFFPDQEKIDAILSLDRPHNVHTVRKLLGCLNFYSEFLCNLQHIVKPISDLLKGKKDSDKIEWTLDAEMAWLRTKLLIRSDLILHLPNYEKNQFHLVTDASNISLAMMLMQRNADDSDWEIISYHSKKCNDTESRYAQAELELYSIVEGLRHFKDILQSAEVYVHTDCRALLYMRLFEASSSKLARQLAFIGSFNIKYVFESSTTPLIKHVDYLTRPVDNVTSKQPYSQIRKEMFDSLPPIKLKDLDDNMVNKPEDLWPLLQKFLDTHVQQVNLILEDRVNFPSDDILPTNVRYTSRTAPLVCIEGAALSRAFGESKDSTIVQGDTNKYAIKCAYSNTMHPSIDSHCVFSASSKHTEDKSDTSHQENQSKEKTGLINLLKFECPVMDWDSIIAGQKSHPQFRQIFTMCSKNDGVYNAFHLIDGVLYKMLQITDRKYLLLMLPAYHMYEVVAQVHRSALVGHQSTRRLWEFVKRRFYAPGLKRIVTFTVQSCSICNQYTPATAKRRILSTPIVGKGPGDIYHLDVCVISHKTFKGEMQRPSSFVTCVDSKTKFCIAWGVPKDYSQEDLIQDFVSRVIAPFGKPRAILTDGEFHTINMHDFCNALFIQKLRISPRSSKSNLAERMHRSLLKAIQIYREERNMKAVLWPALLAWAVLAWNHTENAKGVIPAELFLGRRQDHPWACFSSLPFSISNFSPGVASVLQAQEIVANAMSKAEEYQAELDEKEKGADLRAADFPPGTRVYVKAPLLNEHYKKLRERWRGTYIVVKEMPTACMVVPLRQQIKYEIDQLPADAPHGVAPPLTHQWKKVDKSELKKCRTLTFFSRPLAHEFKSQFLAPYNTDVEYEPDIYESATDLLRNEDGFP